MKRIMASLLVIIMVGSVSFGATFEDAKNTAAYQNLALELMGMDQQIIEAKRVEKRMDSLIDMLPLLSMYGQGASIKEEFDYIYLRDTTVAFANYGKTSIELNLEMLKNTMLLTTRDIYLGYLNAWLSADLAKEKFMLASEAFQRAKDRYELGQISENDYEKEKVTLLEEELRFQESKNQLTSMKETYNSFLLKPLDTGILLRSEPIDQSTLRPLEWYLEKALEKNNKLALKNAELKLVDLRITTYQVEDGHYLMLSSVQGDLRKAKLEREIILLEVKEIEEQLERDIRKLLSEIEGLRSSVQQLKTALEGQKDQYEEFSLLMEQGLMKEADLANFSLVVKELENQLKVLSYQHNTLMHKLYFYTESGVANE